MLKCTVLLELQSYHCAAMTCGGAIHRPHRHKVCLPSGHAVDGAQVACGSVVVLSSKDTPHNTRAVLSSKDTPHNTRAVISSKYTLHNTMSVISCKGILQNALAVLSSKDTSHNTTAVISCKNTLRNAPAIVSSSDIPCNATHVLSYKIISHSTFCGMYFIHFSTKFQQRYHINTGYGNNMLLTTHQDLQRDPELYCPGLVCWHFVGLMGWALGIVKIHPIHLASLMFGIQTDCLR